MASSGVLFLGMPTISSALATFSSGHTLTGAGGALMSMRVVPSPERRVTLPALVVTVTVPTGSAPAREGVV